MTLTANPQETTHAPTARADDSQRSGARPPRAAVGRSRPLVGALVHCALRVGALLPLWSMQCLGTSIGTLAGWLPTRSRHRSLVNIRHCLPELSAREQRRLARRSLASMACMTLELPAFWRWPRARVLRLVKGVSGAEHIAAARARGRGVLLAMPHLGAWELCGLHCSASHPMTALVRPSRLAQMDAVFTAGRGRFGAKLAPTGVPGVRALRRALGAAEVAVVLPDTDPRLGRGVFAPLFHRTAYTSTLSSRLARMDDVVVLMCFVERLGIGRGFHIHYLPTSPALGDADPVVAATALNDELARLIRRAPEQYLWRYRRFRTQPEGAPRLYTRPPRLGSARSALKGATRRSGG